MCSMKTLYIYIYQIPVFSYINTEVVISDLVRNPTTVFI